MKPLPIPPAMRDHFAWLDNMKKLLANPHMDAISKHLKREHERMVALVGLVTPALPSPPSRPAQLPPVLNITVNVTLDGVESDAAGGAV
jgi:hypothetical protein